MFVQAMLISFLWTAKVGYLFRAIIFPSKVQPYMYAAKTDI